MNNSHNSIFCLIGYRFINLHLGTINSNIGKIKLNSDIEYLHRTRVASRKIRAALKVFCSCLRKNESEKFSADIKKITRSLGETRDLDVQIQFLNEVLNKNKKKKIVAGIETVLQHKRILRSRIQIQLDHALTEYERNDYPSIYSKLFKENFTDTRLYKIKARLAIQSSKFINSIQNIIIEILSLSEMIKDRKNISELHELRIQIKKLRYALELIYPFYQAELEKKLNVLKKLQDILGVIHDLDVWIEYLPNFLKKEIYKTESELNITDSKKNIKVGISFLSVYCKKKREKQFNKFYASWQKLMEKKFWNDLIKIEYPA